MSLRRPRRLALDDGWRFGFEAGDWEPVRVPHSCNGLDTMPAGGDRYRRGTGVYELGLPGVDVGRGGRLGLEVEAASQKALVRVDGVEAGLVEAKKRGIWVYYRLAPGLAPESLRLLDALIA